MHKYIISCCSPVDLDRKTLEEKDIKYVYFHFSLGNDTYDDDFGETVPPADMYRRMLAGEVSRTSQVSVGEYSEFFEPFLAEGKDIVHISLSAGISGTYNSAVIAAEDLRAKGIDTLYLLTDHTGFYERYGWEFLCTVQADGEATPSRMYVHRA